MDQRQLAAELRRAGQAHVAEHLENLDAGPRERLARQLAGFDYVLVRRLTELAGTAAERQVTGEFEPAPVVPASRAAARIAVARAEGEAAAGRGEVAAFVVAGGQGTRLRFDGPKGCYEIGPVSGKSLFQIHAEKVLASQRRYAATIPLYIMTSETNDAGVRSFFEQNAFFGLDPADVFFCVQRMLPAFDAEGRFLLDAPDHVFVNPDGHGGAYFALESSGAFDDMARRGIRHLSYFQVDNPMVPVIDPVFVGEHVAAGSEMSSKVLRKREPLEKLGVFGQVDGELRVIEYSDMSEELQRRTLPDGSLRYAFGSIAIHMLDVGFARRMASSDMPFHIARKRIPCLDARGRMVEPDGPNAIKFERFVFDAVPRARNPVVMEVLREDEFAPVKNFSGDDSPETARAAMTAQHHRWLRAAVGGVPDDCEVEISPLFALDAEELAAKAGGLRIERRMYVE